MKPEICHPDGVSIRIAKRYREIGAAPDDVALLALELSFITVCDPFTHNCGKLKVYQKVGFNPNKKAVGWLE
jgi:hypothetical protein